MKYELTLKEAAFLTYALETPKIKALYDALVKNLMEVGEYSEDEAKSLVFPEFLSAIKKLAKEDV